MTRKQCLSIFVVVLTLAGQTDCLHVSDSPIQVPEDDELAPWSNASGTCPHTGCTKLPFDSFLLLQVYGRGPGPEMIDRLNKKVLMDGGSLEPLPNADPDAHAGTRLLSNLGSCSTWMLHKISTVQQQLPSQNLVKLETASVLIVLICLSVALCVVICAFVFFRDDKAQEITPLCPQLFTQNEEIKFTTPFYHTKGDIIVTNSEKNEPICRVAMKWPDPTEPKRPGASSIGATVRLANNHDTTLATVIVKKTPTGQGIALTRTGCEIFGFVEPDGKHEYRVRHRTGVHLLTLVGDFTNFDIEGFNPVDTKVFTFKQVDGQFKGKIIQNVDAGLVFCSLFAAYVHGKLESSMFSRQLEPRKFPPPLPPLPLKATRSPGRQDSKDSTSSSQASQEAKKPVNSGSGDPFYG